MASIQSGSIEIAESALRRLEANPSLKALLEKAGVEVANGTATITASSPAALKRLQKAAQEAGLSSAAPATAATAATEAAASGSTGKFPPAPPASPAPAAPSVEGPQPGGIPAAGPQPDGFGMKVDAATAAVGDTAQSRGMSPGAKLGLGAAGIGAAGYAATRGAEAPAPAAEEPNKEFTPAPERPGVPAAPVPAAAPARTPRDVPRVGFTPVKATQLIADPNYLKDVLDEDDRQIDEIKKSKTDWTEEDDRKWASDKAELRDIARAAQRRNDWAEVAERVAHALTQWSAAKAGLASGTDMSGLKFDKVDWARKNDQIMQNLKQDLGLVSDEEGARRTTVRTAKEGLDKLIEHKQRTREKRDEYRRDIDVRNAGFESDKNNTDARTRQGANETNANLQDRELGRQTQEQEGDLNRKNKDDDAEAKVARSLQLKLAEQDYKAADKRYTAFNKAGAILASVKDDPKALKAKLAQIGEQAGTAGLGTEWSEIIAAAETKDNDEWFGKSKEEHILDILKEKEGKFLQDRDAKKAAWTSAASGPPAGAAPAAGTQPARDPQIEQYATQNKLTYEQAKAIIDRRRAGGQ